MTEKAELTDIQAGVPPGGMAAEKRRVDLKNKNLAYRDEGRPWKWHLTDEGLRVLKSS